MPDIVTQIYNLIFTGMGAGIGAGLGVPIGNKIIKMFERHQDKIVDQAKRLVPNGDKKQEIPYDTPKSFKSETESQDTFSKQRTQ